MTELKIYIQEKNEFLSALLNFIDVTNDSDKEYEKLIKILEKHGNFQNKREIQTYFQFISNIADNYHRPPNFFCKLEQIMGYLIQKNETQISNYLTDYENYNIRIQYFLFEKRAIILKSSYLDYLLKSENQNILFYLYPVINQFLDTQKQNFIHSTILQQNESFDIFVKKCKIGENDSYLASIIRQDLIDDFITYMNRTNIPFTHKINKSIFETNLFLKNRQPTILEYATFFGSIQIFEHLKLSNVKFSTSLLLYAIHSNNAEILSILINDSILPTSPEVLNESIKCYHNEISEFLFREYPSAFNFQSFFESFLNSFNFHFLNENYDFNIDQIIENGGNLLFLDICTKLNFSMNTLTIPENIKKINNGCFYNFKTIKKIVLQNSIKEISENAFLNCTSLEEINIPSSVTKIKGNAFKKCSSLKKISIPSSVNEIGGSAFYKCSSLEKVEFVGFSSLVSISGCLFYECSSLVEISIPISVRSIGDFAFYCCKSLKRVSIPSSVISIGECAFSKCSSLVERNISSSNIKISKNAFYGCPC